MSSSVSSISVRRYPCSLKKRDGPQDDPSGVAVRSCLLIVYNLLLDRLADSSWGILCQASSGSPEIIHFVDLKAAGYVKTFQV